jgi:hypothetical protein
MGNLIFEPGSKLTQIGEEAFSGCRSLKSLYIPASYYSPNFHWLHDSSIESLTFEPGSKLTEIDDNGFRDCSSLKSLCLPASYASASFEWLKNSSIASLSFESGSKLTQIEEGAFWHCLSLKSICLSPSSDSPNFHRLSGTSIGTSTFDTESKLTRIDAEAFSNCWSLQSICLPASVETLCRCCFSHCFKLSTITFDFGSKLRRIESDAFQRCSSLYSLSIPASIVELCPDWSRGSNLMRVKFASGASVLRMKERGLFWMNEQIQIEIVDSGSRYIFRDLPVHFAGSRSPHRSLFPGDRDFSEVLRTCHGTDSSDEFSHGYDQCLVAISSSGGDSR